MLLHLTHTHTQRQEVHAMHAEEDCCGSTVTAAVQVMGVRKRDVKMSFPDQERSVSKQHDFLSSSLAPLDSQAQEWTLVRKRHLSLRKCTIVRIIRLMMMTVCSSSSSTH